MLPFRVIFNVECMRGSAEGDDRSSAFEIVVEMLHFLIPEVREPHEKHHQVGLIEHIQAFYIRASGENIPVGVERVHDRTREPVALGHNACQRGKRFFAAVFMVCGYKNDVFTYARPLIALVHYPVLRRIVLRPGAESDQCNAERQHRFKKILHKIRTEKRWLIKARISGPFRG
jgi:hypothetical protein